MSNMIVQSCPLAAAFRLAHCSYLRAIDTGYFIKTRVKGSCLLLSHQWQSQDSKFICMFPQGKWCKSTSQLSSTDLLPLEVLVEFGSDFALPGTALTLCSSPLPLFWLSAAPRQSRCGQKHLNSFSNILF